MALATTQVADTFLNVVTGTPIDCPWPLFAEAEVTVVYGKASLVAVLNTDYTVTLDGPDFDEFTITPLASLLTKIATLIVIDPTEINYITVRRVLPLTTSVTSEIVRNVVFLSTELERLWMADQQVAETLSRALQFPVSEVGSDSTNVFLPQAEFRAGKAVVFDDDGNVTVSMDDYNDQATQAAEAAAAAEAAQTASVALLAQTTTQAGIATDKATEAAASAATIGGFNLSGTQTANDVIQWDTGTSKWIRKTLASLRALIVPIVTADITALNITTGLLAANAVTNTKLAQIPAMSIKGNPTVAAAAAVDTDFAAFMTAYFNQSVGNILYKGAVNWTTIAPGTAGQVLQTNGAAAPTWVDGPIKAWATFSGVSTVSILASNNVTSITRLAAGRYTTTMASAQPDDKYVAVGMGSRAAASTSSTALSLDMTVVPTTTSFTLNNENIAGANEDALRASFIVTR